jgi:hypothetical protein
MEEDAFEVESFKNAEHSVVAGCGIAWAAAGHAPRADAFAGGERWQAVFGFAFFAAFFDVLFPIGDKFCQFGVPVECGLSFFDGGEISGGQRIVLEFVAGDEAFDGCAAA